jgi:ribonuclease D
MEELNIQQALWVDTTGELEALVGAIDGAQVLGIDFEMDSFWSYTGKICLMQISDGTTDWLIDPLAVSIDGLRTVFENEKVCKIFHDGEFDIRQLKRDYGFNVRGVFDTRAASALLSKAAPGLASVLNERFGVTLSKKYQRADWTKRPLSTEEKHYAQLDVHFLIALREQLERELTEAQLVPILATEHRRLEELSPLGEPYPAENFAKIKGASQLSGRERRRLRELYVARNDLASQEDLAPFRMLNNSTLIGLAQYPPTNETELRRHRGFPKRPRSVLISACMEALARAESLPDINDRRRPQTGPKLSRAQRERMEALRKWRTRYANERAIEGSLLLRKSTMLALVLDDQCNAKNLGNHLDPWQVTTFGDQLLTLLAK